MIECTVRLETHLLDWAYFSKDSYIYNRKIEIARTIIRKLSPKTTGQCCLDDFEWIITDDLGVYVIIRCRASPLKLMWKLWWTKDQE